MAEVTNRTLLSEVESAISKLLSGAIQEYYIGGRRITYLNVKDLMEIRDRLRVAVALEESGGSMEAQVTFE